MTCLCLIHDSICWKTAPDRLLCTWGECTKESPCNHSDKSHNIRTKNGDPLPALYFNIGFHRKQTNKFKMHRSNYVTWEWQIQIGCGNLSWSGSRLLVLVLTLLSLLKYQQYVINQAPIKPWVTNGVVRNSLAFYPRIWCYQLGIANM